MTTARVAVVGAGPGGLAAASRLGERAGERIEVLLFEREATAEYLPGTIPVFMGQTPRARWRRRLDPRGAKVEFGEVEEVSGGGVRIEGGWVEADAVVASPGLVLAPERVPDAPNVHTFWDPEGAEGASEAARGLRGGTVALVVSSLPYRCPPAPYGAAMELAAHYRREGRDVRVVLTTPEAVPLAAIGGDVPEFLADSCAAVGVELLTGFEPDLSGLGDGRLRSRSGVEVGYDLAFVVPPHARSPLLAGLPGGGPLAAVSPRFESALPNLFVVGDAAMVPLPRAADVAAAGGRTAADAVLENLGLCGGGEPHPPAPECYLPHGGGSYSRISLRYPYGMPPLAGPEVTLEGPSAHLAAGFEASFDRWRSQGEGERAG
jgi:sulfide:quinone oxidoreductase